MDDDGGKQPKVWLLSSKTTLNEGEEMIVEAYISGMNDEVTIPLRLILGTADAAGYGRFPHRAVLRFPGTIGHFAPKIVADSDHR